MAWYGASGWDYYPPYLSAAEKRAHGARALEKLLKKSKRAAEPVLLDHRKRQLAATFWGQAWADNLERYADLANRLPRGRAYLRNGSVLDLTIGRGRVEAYVAGTELYRVTIGIAPLAKARWRRVVDALHRPDRLPRRSAARRAVRRRARGPHRRERRALPRAARVGARLLVSGRRRACASTSPPSCTAWPSGSIRGRSCSSSCAGVDQAELIGSATAAAVARPRPVAGKRIAADRLSSVFGIELEEGGVRRARAPRDRRARRPG